MEKDTSGIQMVSLGKSVSAHRRKLKCRRHSTQWREKERDDWSQLNAPYTMTKCRICPRTWHMPVKRDSHSRWIVLVNNENKTKQERKTEKKQTSTLLFSVWCVHFGPDNKIIIFKMWELQMFLSSTRMWMWQNIIKLQCAAAHHTDHIHVPWSTSNEIWWWGFLLLFFVSLDQASSSKNISNLLNFGNYLRFYLFKQIARWVSILFCRRNLYLSHSIVRVCVFA